MKNLFDYVEGYGNLTFNELSFNELDGVILALTSLIDVANCIPFIGKESIQFKEVIKKQVELHGINQLGLIISQALARLLVQASSTIRFSSLLVGDLVQNINLEEETQTTCFSVFLPNKTRIVVCGGTDDTIVGWKEDFKMMIDGHVPCLEHSCDYLNMVGEHSKKIIVLGHSKGGMEALYAAAFAKRKVRNKIIDAYSFDGPGYPKDVIESKNFISMLDRMHLIVPNGGLVGRLFLNPVEPKIVPSSYRGLNQHDPLSWEVIDDHFAKANEFTVQSNALINRMNEIITSLNIDEKEEFISNLFLIFNAGGALTLTDIGKKPHKALVQYLKLPKNKRSLINSLIIKLVNDKIVARELLIGAITIPKTQ